MQFFDLVNSQIESLEEIPTLVPFQSIEQSDQVYFDLIDKYTDLIKKFFNLYSNLEEFGLNAKVLLLEEQLTQLVNRRDSLAKPFALLENAKQTNSDSESGSSSSFFSRLKSMFTSY